MDSLVRRLHIAEIELSSMREKLSTCKQELKNKDQIIADLKKKLEDKAKRVQEVTSKSRGNDRSTEELENCYRKSQKQITEMEKFLADYGLKWVGEDKSKQDRSDIFDTNFECGDTVVETFSFDFDIVMKNIAYLNKLAGDGELQIMHTPKGAVLKNPERVPLKFYANGFIFSSEPFCEYSETRAQQFIGDLMDCFFPSELQLLYPDGVIMDASDKRNHVYEKEKEIWKPFTGKGFRLGSGN